LDAPFSAGYIQLKSSADIRIFEIKGIESSLEDWTQAIARLGKILGAGDFRAEPFPVSEVTGREKTCEKCPVITLCREGVRDHGHENDEGAHEETE